MTYRELNERANRLAQHLCGLGVGPGVRVAICVERSFDMLIGLLGIFKAGGAFVPIEPAFPRERMAFMLADAQVDVLLTQRHIYDLRFTIYDLEESAPAIQNPKSKIQNPVVVCLDTDWAMIARESSEPLPNDVTSDDLAYIIYTSGSTGRPKGVLIPHYGLVNYLAWCAEAYGAAHGRGAPVHASIAADAIFPSLFAPLLVGTSVLMFPGEDVLEALGTAMHTQGRFSMIKITPSQLEVLNHQLPQTDANGWVRTLVVGAEALHGEVLTFWQAFAPTTILLNEYGPTETVVGCSIYQVSIGQPIAGAVPIGLPIANTQFYVLDAQMRPVPVGVPGELYIGGDGVAWGYHNRPDLTAEKFIPNPFVEDKETRPAPSGNEGRQGDKETGNNEPATQNLKFKTQNLRLYRTGDLVRYLPDRAGNIEFLGRIDDQVKIRGYRIEPGEIAAALLQHPAVRDAVVLAREDVPGDTRLVAYVVQGSGVRGQGSGRQADKQTSRQADKQTGDDAAVTQNSKLKTQSSPPPQSPIPNPQSPISELRDFLKEKLPDYMVPSAFVLLEALPLAPHGKLDRRALPAPDMTSLELRSAYVAPRNPLEEQLAAIWADVLRMEQVGVHDNFFALGGHSLLATQIVSRVRRTLQVELSLRSLFETPTVATLAERIEMMRRSTQAPRLPPIRPVARDDALPLSFAQQRLWFLHQLQPDSPAYNIPVALRLVGPLDQAALEHSLNTIIARHEALRTTFALLDGRPVQRITPQLTLTLTVEDLPAAQHDEVRRRFAAENQQPFDLARGPLVRTTLLRLAAQEHLLLLTMHHIVSDGWSTGVLIQEASLLYSAAVQGRPAALPDLPIQYADFAVWQRQWLQGPGVGGQGSEDTGQRDKETRPAPSGNEGRQGDKETGRQDPSLRLSPQSHALSASEGSVLSPQSSAVSPLQAQLAYWREQLGGRLPVLELPTDRPRPAVQTFQGRVAPFTFSLDLARALSALSQQEGVTLFMTLLAAFQTLLHRYSAQDDLIVGSPIAGRTHAETEGLIGFFVNTLALRVNLAGDPRFRELLGRVREVCLGAYAHQDLPFEKLVEELRPERDLSRTPLFQVMLVLQNAPASALELAGLTLYQLQIDGGTARFDLNMSLEESDHGLRGLLEYNTDLFDDTTIARLLRHFETILQGVVAQPEQRLSALPLMSDAERRQVLAEWSATGTDELPEQCLHQLIEAQAARTPNAIALVFDRGQESGVRGQEDTETRRHGDTEIGRHAETQLPSPIPARPLRYACPPSPGTQQLPYRELNRRANQLAHHLRNLGVGPDVPVAVCMERSPELVVALLGILKAGGAYVPLDPTYPQERLAFMLADTQAPVLLTQKSIYDLRFTIYDLEESASAIVNRKSKIVNLDSDWPLIARLRTDAPPSPVAPDNLAYVIYTSGSTGVPKGVMISHRAIVNRLRWMQATYHLAAHDRVLQKTPISFDVSVWELFWPLLTGACMVLARPGGHQDSAYLRQLIVDQAITTLHFVPSMLGVFLEERDLWQCAGLARVICSGEALSYELQERCFARLDDVELHNLYGPTEAAVDVTAWACERASARHVVPIGRPIANMQVYVLDSHLQPVPVGVPGELHLGGVGLARGYLDRPDLTAERFVPNPFADHRPPTNDSSYPITLSPLVPTRGRPCHLVTLSPCHGDRLYKTGDLVRYLADGVIEYLGRIDGQVKLRGYRIELGEIEAALERHPAVRAAVVVAHEDVPGDRRLVAYVVEGSGVRDQGSGELAHETLIPDPRSLTPDLRGFLKETLPEYMVPSAFVTLEALPLTPNGKLDRRALPAPDTARPDLNKGFVAPRTATEEQLAGIMAEILVLERVGVYDSFFELGGHSLLAIQLLARLRDVFDLELPLRTLYEAPNVADLAMVVVQRQADRMDTEALDQMLAELGELSDAEVQMLLADQEEVNQDASA